MSSGAAVKPIARAELNNKLRIICCPLPIDRLFPVDVSGFPPSDSSGIASYHADEGYAATQFGTFFFSSNSLRVVARTRLLLSPHRDIAIAPDAGHAFCPAFPPSQPRGPIASLMAPIAARRFRIGAMSEAIGFFKGENDLGHPTQLRGKIFPHPPHVRKSCSFVPTTYISSLRTVCHSLLTRT
jgi:hypothetical protein